MALSREWNLAEEVALASLLALPGVVREDSTAGCDPARQWPLVQETLEAALANLDQMRREEGRTMSADLLANCRAAAASLAEIERRSPLVVESYRARLEERLKRTLAELDVTLNPGDIIKEVSLFADRSDISEEIVRLRSHIEQFEAIVACAGEFRAEARFPHPGDGPRGQHHRIEGQRRGDRPAGDRDQKPRSSGSGK